ncbi:MAG: hypothetical protein L6367_12950, partial [Cellulomonas sp.]|nr:hypothetical protein [Cellulomonas sp.]
MAHRDVEELKAEYPDAGWRDRFSRVCDLVEILADCFISDNYAISDALNDAILLTPAGLAVREKLAAKHDVPAKEAKLMCALTIGHSELFVDVDKIDICKLVAAIGGELAKGRIRFPYIFGRGLYDRYAELHEDEKDSLTVEETTSLIGPLPPGVFQYGYYTVGPFGLQEAPTCRSLQSVRHVPAYHCSRTTCRSIHPVLLETSQAAPINREREKLSALLRGASEEPAEWWPFAAAVSGLADSHFGDQKTATLIPIVGDCLALPELRMLVADLFDTTSGTLRSAVAPFF